MRTASTSSLRAQRSNPESLRGDSLDCFAALAMTEQDARVRSSNAHLGVVTILAIVWHGAAHLVKSLATSLAFCKPLS
ncbi:hypothetical protein C7G41_25500 [Bradyrhizobium sp. MOS002]|nr:hypothetical protein C7G41_25500 [Bradyrhizobium sp. MOS002]